MFIAKDERPGHLSWAVQIPTLTRVATTLGTTNNQSANTQRFPGLEEDHAAHCVM